jgi:hypothetical protein
MDIHTPTTVPQDENMGTAIATRTRATKADAEAFYSTLPAELAAEARAVAHKMRPEVDKYNASRRAIEDYMLIMQGKLGHGRFLKWLQVEFGFPERTAYSYINAARARAEVATIANLSAEVIEAVAAPSITETHRREIIERLKAGEPFTKEKIRAEVRARGNKPRFARATRVSLPPQTAPGTKRGSAASTDLDMPTPVAPERDIAVQENDSPVNNDREPLASVAEPVAPEPDLRARADSAMDLMMMHLGTPATKRFLKLSKGFQFADLQAAYERYMDKLGTRG